jgi:hypothetical protein
MSSAGETVSDYSRRGYAHIRAAAPPDVAHNLLGIVSRDLARPGIGERALRSPAISAKACYEIYSYHYPLLTGFHWGLTARMCDVTGKKLLPTYGFFRVYQQGDICIVHSDRPSCEHSLSLALAYADDIVWSFEIGTRHYEFEAACQLKASDNFGDEPHSTVFLPPGDAILYQGVNRRHGRMSPNPNKWSAHLFLHWVDSEGPYKEWVFDKQVIPQPGGFYFPPQGAVRPVTPTGA